MSNNLSANFFKKNGRELKVNIPKTGMVIYSERAEVITSLFADLPAQTLPKTKNMNPTIDWKKLYGIVQKNKYAVAGITAAICLFSGMFVNASFTPVRYIPDHANRYSIYSSKPLTIEQASSEIHTRDSRAQKINEVFRFYKCPMEGLGDTLVNEADKNNIPWTLVASVAFKESSCGKNTPTVDGVNSYNAWGWGVYGGNVKMFDNWVRGIETVSKYFADNFYSKGITDTCDIMKIYTPPSNGSWCADVNHFSEVIESYESPMN